MYYYCYISENKINQLIDQLEDGLTEEYMVGNEKKISARLDGEIGVWKVLNSKLTFGLNKKIYSSKKKRDTILAKLNRCVKLIKNKYSSIPAYESITLELLSSNKIMSLDSELMVENYDGQFVYLKNANSSCIPMKLTCSLKYFSDMYGNETSNPINSGNKDFFDGNVNPVFSGLIYIIGLMDEQILGTPLFLAIPLDNNFDL